MLATQSRSKAKPAHPMFTAEPDWTAVRSAAQKHKERETLIPAVFGLTACFAAGRITLQHWLSLGSRSDAETWLSALSQAHRALMEQRPIPIGLHFHRAGAAVTEYRRLMSAAGLSPDISPDKAPRAAVTEVLAAGMLKWLWQKGEDGGYLRMTADEADARWMPVDRNSEFRDARIIAALPFRIPAKDPGHRDAVFLSFVQPLTYESLTRAGGGRIRFEDIDSPSYDRTTDKVTRRQATSCFLDGRMVMHRPGATLAVSEDVAADLLVDALLTDNHNDFAIRRILSANAEKLGRLRQLGLTSLMMSDADIRAHYRKAVGTNCGLHGVDPQAFKLPALDPAKVAEALGESGNPAILSDLVDVTAVARHQKAAQTRRLTAELAPFERTVRTMLETWAAELKFVLPKPLGVAELAQGPVVLVQDNSIVLKAAGNPNTWGVKATQAKSLRAPTFGRFELELSAVYCTDGKLRLVASVNPR